MTAGEQARRRRVELRAGVLIGLSGTATVVLPVVSLLVLYGPGGWATGTVAGAAALLMLAVLGFCGWWIDAVRAWWQLDWWVHRFRSTAAWLIPFVNLFAITQESRILLDRVEAPRWVGRLFYVGFGVCVLLSWFRQTWAEVVSTGLVGLLPLALVLLTMRSLRAEWRRRDDEAAQGLRTGGSTEFG